MTTPSPVEALRACPFCGEPPDLDATDKHDYMHQISCPGCDITMMASAVSPDLVTAWNTRAALPLAEQQEKAFATMLEALEEAVATARGNAGHGSATIPLGLVEEMETAIQAAKEPQP